ncbi:MAG: baseplate J/gp47 family protein [Oscillospiraceae bacterium]
MDFNYGEMVLSQMEHYGKIIIPRDSDIAILTNILMQQVYNLENKIKAYENQIFPDSATGDFLTMHGEIKGIYRKQPCKATGSISFIANQNVTTDIIIPMGTMLASSANKSVMYITTKETTMSKGTNVAVASIEAVEAGSSHNIASLMIDILVTPIEHISKVQNNSAVLGGEDIESDELYRQRITNEYKTISNGCNISYLEQLAQNINGVNFAKAEFINTNTLNVYVENVGRNISDNVISLVLQELEKKRVAGIKINVLKAEKLPINTNITICCDNFFNKGTLNLQALKVINDFVDKMEIGEDFSLPKLSKELLSINGIDDIIINSPNFSVNVENNQIAVNGTHTLSFK